MASTKQEQKIARLYYLEGYSQSEIGKKLSISIATVSRALNRAKELGIVTITIKEDEQSFGALEAALEKKFSLAQCIITPSFDQPGAVYGAMAVALEEIIPRILPKNGLVGVSWGETLKAVVDSLRLPRLELDTVPMMGGMGMVETGIFPNSIARVLAEKAGGKSYLVNAPAVSDSSEMTRGFFESKAFAPVRGLWSKIDLALVGCSGIGSDTSVARNAIFSFDELESLKNNGAVSAVNFTFLSGNGQVVTSPIADRILHLGFADLNRIPRVVLLAHGSQKVEPMHAALRSKLVHILITDYQTAEHLQNLLI